LAQIRRIIAEIAQSVDHVHSMGLIHGDLNPMNIVRVGKRWKLIDMDNAARIGEDAIGDKLSSAFAPPEAFYVDNFTSTVHPRSLGAFRVNSDVDILIAHPSYDVWALGCVMYQLLSADSLPLFVTGKGDNLSTHSNTHTPQQSHTNSNTNIIVGGTGGASPDVFDVSEDTIWSLLNWNDEIKNRKLNRIADPLARNLVSQMLQRDPRLRPSMARVLAHPFLSLRNVPRLLGEQPEFDVYLSHRGAPDTQDYVLAAELYRQLQQKHKLKVFWAPLCMADECAWRDEFSGALVNASIFVPIVSRSSLSHPLNPRFNVKNLEQDSICDDLVLEYRLAVELRDMGFIQQIFPLMVGDVTSLKVADENDEEVAAAAETVRNLHRRDSEELMKVTYSNYFFTGCFPRAPNTHIDSLESDLMSHLELLGLGQPLFPQRPVSSVLSEILSCSGAFVEGDYLFCCPDPTIRDSAAVLPAPSSQPQQQQTPQALQAQMQLQDCPDLEFAASVLMASVVEQVSELVTKAAESNVFISGISSSSAAARFTPTR
jgi:serine/threonine protein kinase